MFILIKISSLDEYIITDDHKNQYICLSLSDFLNMHMFKHVYTLIYLNENEIQGIVQFNYKQFQ